jgi:hypothetical protein
VFIYQEGGEAHRVVLEDYTWHPNSRPPKSGASWDGTFIARLKEL